MKVAAVQFRPVWGKKEANLLELGRLIMTAAKAGAKLVVLPELCTTGYTFMNEEDARKQAEIVGSGRTLQFMQELARRLRINLVWGMMEEEPGTGYLFNSQIFTTSGGFYQGYRKINLWSTDFLWAKPGTNNPPVIRVVDGEHVYKMGLVICRDVRDKTNEKDSYFYEPGDADFVAMSANWGDGGFPSVSWVDFTKDNKCSLIVSNRYGAEMPNNFGEGGVCVIHPCGRIECEGLKWNEPCIVYGDV
jgi:predicted amidohydrolase